MPPALEQIGGWFYFWAADEPKGEGREGDQRLAGQTLKS